MNLRDIIVQYDIISNQPWLYHKFCIGNNIVAYVKVFEGSPLMISTIQTRDGEVLKVGAEISLLWLAKERRLGNSERGTTTFKRWR